MKYSFKLPIDLPRLIVFFLSRELGRSVPRIKLPTELDSTPRTEREVTA